MKVGEESLFEGEGTVEMMELESELDCEEGGENFVESKSTEGEDVTTQKRDPANQVEDLSPQIMPES